MNKPHLVFVCVENSNRSQMAEAFAKFHGGDRVVAYSAGSRPSGRVNPSAIRAMADKGIDISHNDSKALTDLPAVKWDWIVTMGCGDSCPHLPAMNRADWDLVDPKNLPYDEFLQVRDDIERRVKELLASIDLE